MSKKYYFTYLLQYILGWTSLMYAAQNGHHVVVKLLLENNADVQAKSNSGKY